MADTPTDATNADAEQLAALGYDTTFNREMSLWENFSLGFTYLSPVVGVYSLFALALAAGGPPMIFWLLIVGIGQLLVALVFSEVVSQYPISGGVYPWARRLWGAKWAWMTGWIYAWALMATIASVTYGAGPFVAALFGMESSQNLTIIIALVLILAVTLVNLQGTRVLGRVAMFGFIAEILGALILGAWLILFDRNQDFGVIFDNFGLVDESGSYLPAFIAAALIGLFQYYGFEACGDVAEEVPNPGRQIPKAMRMTIYIGGAAAIFICYALILAVVDIPAVIAGENADPIGTILNESFGDVGSKVILAVVLISFFSCALSLQAAVSRMIYSYGRDEMIFGSGILSRVSPGKHMPPAALWLAAAVPAFLVIIDLFIEGGLVRIVSFAALGIYLAFQMVVLAALRARIKGWKPGGTYTLGGWGMIVNVLALAYGLFGIWLLAKPYGVPEWSFLDNWIVSISAVIIIAIGLVYMLVARPYAKGDHPAGDAIESSRV
jgi:amino acid transporter